GAGLFRFLLLGLGGLGPRGRLALGLGPRLGLSGLLGGHGVLLVVMDRWAGCHHQAAGTTRRDPPRRGSAYDPQKSGQCSRTRSRTSWRVCLSQSRWRTTRANSASGSSRVDAAWTNSSLAGSMFFSFHAGDVVEAGHSYLSIAEGIKAIRCVFPGF